jgi:hypothetical protein
VVRQGQDRSALKYSRTSLQLSMLILETGRLRVRGLCWKSRSSTVATSHSFFLFGGFSA